MTTEDTIFMLPEVQPNENNMRLDRFLAQKMPEMSRS